MWVVYDDQSVVKISIIDLFTQEFSFMLVENTFSAIYTHNVRLFFLLNNYWNMNFVLKTCIFLYNFFFKSLI